MSVSLIVLREDNKALFEDFWRDYRDSGEKMVPWLLSLYENDFPDFLQFLADTKNNINRKNLWKGDWVPSSTFFVYDSDVDQIVGCVNIRHWVNQKLLVQGGHIGYGIGPSFRRKGYATKALKLALAELKNCSDDREILVTCDKDNIGSAKTIVKNGGVLRDEVIDGEVLVQRYWISI